MRAPEFWRAPPGLVAGLLAPAAIVFDTAGRLRRAVARPYRAPVPVVCVGNLVAGGAGKTPVALSLAASLAARGAQPHVLVRGYRGRLTGPLRVDPARHDAEAVGDEALLVAARVPCWIGHDRADAARAAAKAGAGMLLLDDGFQNPSVAKDLSLLVIDAAYGIGNGRVMPAGPLRERADAGLARADAIVLLDCPGEPALPMMADKPMLRASLAPIAGERFAGKRVFAFAGIGRPEKFFATLRALHAELVGARAFADHHFFRTDEIAKLRGDSERSGALLVTTAKDIVRLPVAMRANIDVLEVDIRWEDPEQLAGLVAPIVLSAGGDGRDPASARF
jgi:tetraacyldisaccharide 4'-kinase